MQLRHSLTVNGAMDAEYHASALLLAMERQATMRYSVQMEKLDIALPNKNATQPTNSLMANGAMDAGFQYASVQLQALEHQAKTR